MRNLILRRLLLNIVFVMVSESSENGIRWIYMSILFGEEYQCVNTSCLPFTINVAANVRRCQMNCLADVQCKAAAFRKSRISCELFANPPYPTGNMVPNGDVTTMIVTTQTEFSSETTEQSTSLGMTTSCPNTLVTPAGRSPTIGWYFEDNLNDHFGTYNGIGLNNPGFHLGRNGCGKCLNLKSSLNQSIIVNATPYIDIRPLSFSFETWVRPTNISVGLERVIIGQCGSFALKRCMKTSITNQGKMIFSFRFDTRLGNSTIPVDTWVHIAFVYNLTSLTMSLYYNGTLDNEGSGHGAYAGVPSAFQIGTIIGDGTIYFDGCIDEIFFYPFARTASEIAATAALG